MLTRTHGYSCGERIGLDTDSILLVICEPLEVTGVSAAGRAMRDRVDLSGPAVT